MADLHVSWEDYHALIEALAVRISASGWRFDQIVCIARGGLRIGDTLSRLFGQPLAVIATQSYTGEGGTVQGEIRVADHLTMATPALGHRVLLVDDLVDSGLTLEAVRAWLPAHYPQIAEIRTAVLWYKACSRFRPDFHAQYLAENPWIHQPFERYERIDPSELAPRGS
jgi:hypoxanthine phosphoribosyltransferase